MEQLANVSNQTELTGNCSYTDTPFMESKFWLILVFGGAVSLVGTLMNLFLCLVLSRKSMVHSYMVYLLLLAVLDIGILVTFIAVFPVQLLYDRFELLQLYLLWVNYVPYTHFLSKVSCSVCQQLLTCQLPGNFD